MQRNFRAMEQKDLVTVQTFPYARAGMLSLKTLEAEGIDYQLEPQTTNGGCALRVEQEYATPASEMLTSEDFITANAQYRAELEQYLMNLSDIRLMQVMMNYHQWPKDTVLAARLIALDRGLADNMYELDEQIAALREKLCSPKPAPPMLSWATLLLSITLFPLGFAMGLYILLHHHTDPNGSSYPHYNYQGRMVGMGAVVLSMGSLLLSYIGFISW